MTKSRWHTAKGRIIAIRVTESDYTIILRRAQAVGLSPGQYIRWKATRKHTTLTLQDEQTRGIPRRTHAQGQRP